MNISAFASTPAVANKMLDFLNKWPKKPGPFKLDDLPNKGPAVMLQPLQGSQIVKRYVNGSFIAIFSFAIYYRTEMADTAAKKEARQALEDLANWIKESPLPDLGLKRKATEFQQESPPTVAVIDDDTEDLQMLFSLNYHESV